MWYMSQRYEAVFMLGKAGLKLFFVSELLYGGYHSQLFVTKASIFLHLEPKSAFKWNNAGMTSSLPPKLVRVT